MKKDDWIKIEGPETWPKLGELVLARRYVNGPYYFAAEFCMNNGALEFVGPDNERPEPRDITHWMPIVGPE